MRFTDYISFGLSGREYIRVLTKVMPPARKVQKIMDFRNILKKQDEYKLLHENEQLVAKEY